jgi:hypothetical protein
MNTQSIYAGLFYSTREINMNFRIKVYGIDENGNKINKALGVMGLIKLIGIELVNKFLGRAFNSCLDKIVCKLRRGIKVTFYVK